MIAYRHSYLILLEIFVCLPVKISTFLDENVRKCKTILEPNFKIDDEKLKSEFNPYWTLELPPYNEKQVWKGDVEQEMNLTSDSVDMQITRFTGCKIVTIPSSYTLNKKPIALLETTGNEQNKYTIYNLQSRKIDSIKTGDYYRVIQNTDIVLGLNEKNEMKVFSLDEKNKKYFSRSILLNGKVQSVYPLRENLFWARHWAMATKTKFQINHKNRSFKIQTVLLFVFCYLSF